VPYIKVINGVMQEFDGQHLNTGRVASIGLNAYSHLENLSWGHIPADSIHAGHAKYPAYPDDFRFLRQQGFKYVQVMMTPFNGVGGYFSWESVVGRPDFNADNTVRNLNINSTYWNLLQTYLDCAQQNDIGVIACPFWNVQAIPKLLGETNVELTVANSKSRNYLREFSAAFTARFAHHTGIAAWMANQEILNVRLNADAEGKGGTPLCTIHAADMIREVAVQIRQNDPLGRMISSGNAGIPHTVPRQPDLFLDKYLSDTLQALNPDPVDCLCQNLFLDNEYVSSAQEGGDLRADYSSCSLGYLKVMQKVASELKKPFYIGSFGLSTRQERRLPNTAAAQEDLRALLRNMARTGVQLASHWAWNCAATMTEKPDRDGWHILKTATGQNNDRAEVFDVLQGELSNFASTVADDLIQRSKKPFHSTVMNFEVSQAQGRYLAIPHREVYNSQDMSLSFTIRQVKYAAQLYQPFIQHRNTTQGWAILQQACMSYISIASTAGSSNNSGHGAPSDVLNEWVRCTYTVKANGCISLYVDDFLMSQTQGVSPPPFSNQVVPGNAILIGREKNYIAGASREVDSIWQMSDIILYNRVLTPSEVFEYGTSRSPAKDPVGHWTLNDTVKDASVNKNDATWAPGNEPAFVDSARFGGGNPAAVPAAIPAACKAQK
jgi:hypothetical protein